MLAGHLQRGGGCATKVDRHVGRLHRFHFGPRALGLVVGAFVVKRLLGRPHPAQQADVLVAAGVALVMAQKVAIALLVFVRSAGDVVHCHAAIGVVVQRSQLPGRQRGRHKAGAVRQQEVDLLRDRGGVGHRQQRVGAGGAGGHQDAVKTRVFVRLGKHPHIRRVYRRAGVGNGFRNLVRLDHADELDTHVNSLWWIDGGTIEAMYRCDNEENRVSTCGF